MSGEFAEEQIILHALAGHAERVRSLVAGLSQREQDDLEDACDLISKIVSEERE